MRQSSRYPQNTETGRTWTFNASRSSGPITTWWDDLGTPSFDPAVDRKLNDELRAIQGDRSMQELAAERDRLLVEPIDVRRRSFLP